MQKAKKPAELPPGMALYSGGGLRALASASVFTLALMHFEGGKIWQTITEHNGLSGGGWFVASLHHGGLNNLNELTLDKLMEQLQKMKIVAELDATEQNKAVAGGSKAVSDSSTKAASSGSEIKKELIPTERDTDTTVSADSTLAVFSKLPGLKRAVHDFGTGMIAAGADGGDEGKINFWSAHTRQLMGIEEGEDAPTLHDAAGDRAEHLVQHAATAYISITALYKKESESVWLKFQVSPPKPNVGVFKKDGQQTPSSFPVNCTVDKPMTIHRLAATGGTAYAVDYEYLTKGILDSQTTLLPGPRVTVPFTEVDSGSTFNADLSDAGLRNNVPFATCLSSDCRVAWVMDATAGAEFGCNLQMAMVAKRCANYSGIAHSDGVELGKKAHPGDWMIFRKSRGDPADTSTVTRGPELIVYVMGLMDSQTMQVTNASDRADALRKMYVRLVEEPTGLLAIHQALTKEPQQSSDLVQDPATAGGSDTTSHTAENDREPAVPLAPREEKRTSTNDGKRTHGGLYEGFVVAIGAQLLPRSLAAAFSGVNNVRGVVLKDSVAFCFGETSIEVKEWDVLCLWDDSHRSIMLRRDTTSKDIYVRVHCVGPYEVDRDTDTPVGFARNLRRRKR